MNIQEKIRSFCEQDKDLDTDDPKFDELADNLIDDMASSIEETILFLRVCNKDEFDEIAGLLGGVFSKTESFEFLHAVADALSRYPDISGAPILKELLQKNGLARRSFKRFIEG